MHTLTFGLKSAKPPLGGSKLGQKRKAVFDNEQEEEPEDDNDAFAGLQKPKPKTTRLKPSLDDDAEPLRKSPKLGGPSSQSASGTSKYTNLSALRSAKLHNQEASQIDSSVYDYDAAYDTFHAPKEKKDADGTASGPKYMTNLLQSAEIRKRDQLRAKEKLLQKEREAEGDEFADKEKFVTEAYKKQQEEVRRMEEEEEKRLEAEEERRKKGGGMTEFNKSLLRREEERQAEIARAAEEAKKRKDAGEDVENNDGKMELDENKMAAKLNQQGASIVVNDEGEIVDKRQLLGAGLNIAPTQPGATIQKKPAALAQRPQDFRRSDKTRDARQDQRERQTRMIEQQIEEMNKKQQEAEEAERKEVEEKSKSRLTDDIKMSAKERFLQRKREREEAAEKGSAGG